MTNWSDFSPVEEEEKPVDWAAFTPVEEPAEPQPDAQFVSGSRGKMRGGAAPYVAGDDGSAARADVARRDFAAKDPRRVDANVPTILDRPASPDLVAQGDAALARDPSQQISPAGAAKAAALANRGPRIDGALRPLDTAGSLALDAQEISNPVARGAISGFSQLGQTGIGATRLVADLVGADGLAEFAGGASKGAATVARGATEGLGGNAKLAADITSSIINSAPTILLGMASGPAMPALFAQSAMAEYNEGRKSGFGVAESAARAGVMGAAEVIGERFGFSQQIQLFKGAVAGASKAEMSKLFGQMIAREIPGEQLTTLIQFMGDKFGPAAQNPEATLANYLEQAGDTLAVTIGQTAIMGGGPTVVAAAREAFPQKASTAFGRALRDDIRDTSYTQEGALQQAMSYLDTSQGNIDPRLTTKPLVRVEDMPTTPLAPEQIQAIAAANPKPAADPKVLAEEAAAAPMQPLGVAAVAQGSLADMAEQQLGRRTEGGADGLAGPAGVVAGGDAAPGDQPGGSGSDQLDVPGVDAGVGATAAKPAAGGVEAGPLGEVDKSDSALNLAQGLDTFKSKGQALTWAVQNRIAHRVDVMPAPDGKGFVLAPKARQADAATLDEDANEVATINAETAKLGWRNADGSQYTVTPVRDAEAPSWFAPVQRVAEAAFGIRVLPAVGFDGEGVQYGGRAYVNARNTSPGLIIGLTGHESLHWLEVNDPKAAATLRNAIVGTKGKPGLLKGGVVAARMVIENANLTKGEKPMSKAGATSEILGDINGSMWVDPEFWGKVYELDNGSTMRKVMYQFMRAAAKVVRVATGSRFDVSQYVTDAEAVRNVSAKVWAERAQAPRKALAKASTKAPVESSDAPAQARRADGSRIYAYAVDRDGKTLSFETKDGAEAEVAARGGVVRPFKQGPTKSAASDGDLADVELSARGLKSAKSLVARWGRELGDDVRIVMGGSLVSGTFVQTGNDPIDMDVRFLTNNPEAIAGRIAEVTGLEIRKTIQVTDFPVGSSTAVMVEGSIEIDGMTVEVEGAVRNDNYVGWAALYRDVFSPEELADFRAGKRELKGGEKKAYKAFKNAMIMEAQVRAITQGLVPDSKYDVPSTWKEEGGKLFDDKGRGRGIGLSAVERFVEQQFYDLYEADKVGAIDDYRMVFGHIIDADNAKELSPIYRSAPQFANAVHEPSSAIFKQIWSDAMAEYNKPDVVFTAGGPGSGKSYSGAKARELFSVPWDALTYDSSATNAKVIAKRINEAVDAGRKVTLVYTNTPVGKAFRWSMSRKRLMRLDLVARNHARAADAIRTLSAQFEGNPSVNVVVMTRGEGDEFRRGAISDVPVYDYNQVRTELTEIAREAKSEGTISDEKFSFVTEGLLKPGAVLGRPLQGAGGPGQPEGLEPGSRVRGLPGRLAGQEAGELAEEAPGPGDLAPSQARAAKPPKPPKPPKVRKSQAWPGVNAEIAPNPDTANADRWRLMSPLERQRVTRTLADRYVPRVMEMAGLKGSLEFVQGGFEGETNPAILFHMTAESYKERGYPALLSAAKLIGRFLDQKATIAYDENILAGENLSYFVKLTPDRNLTPQEVEGVFSSVYAQFSSAAGFTARDGALVFGNFSDLSPEDFRAGLEAAAASAEFAEPTRITISDRTFRSDYIDESQYGQSDDRQPGQADPGGQYVRRWSGDLDSLQARFREDLQRELIATGQARPRRDSTGLRAGTEDLAKYGIAPGSKRVTVRRLAEALNARAQDVGAFSPYDASPEAREAMAQSMADEVAFQLENDAGADTGTGVGWYSVNWPAAIIKLAKFYPELRSSKNARSLFTALIAITSNGENVRRNLSMAMKLYEGYVHDGKTFLEVGIGTKQQELLDKNLAAFQDLISRMGVGKASDYLLEELLVKDITDQLKLKGEKFNSGYKVDQKLPRSAMIFGPKLGAFFANLMGRDGYLTMDLWWSRTFNRLRGDLLPQATVGSLANIKQLLGNPEMTDEQAIKLAKPFRDAYAKRNFKGDDKLEKAANTLLKAAEDEINEAPNNASDREFMVSSAQRAREILSDKGIDITVADLQAALWYYEKRLYAELGAKASDAIGYEEAIDEVTKKGGREPREPAPHSVFAPRQARAESRAEAEASKYAGVADPFAAGYSALEGRKVTLKIRIADTGQIANFTVDAAQYMRDIDERRDTARQLAACIAR